jgi:hypothetical protein
MIKFKCSQCGKEISAADEHAGRKAKCPGCQAIVQIPGARAAPAPPKPPPRPVVPAVDEVEEAVEEAPPRPRKPAVPAVKAGKPRRDEDEDVEDIEEVQEAPDEDEEEEEDDRPRKMRRKGRKRGRWHGEWADCPNCGAPGDATRLTYTFWGGFIGPMIINTVRCNQCGTTYNGKHGDYNTTRIIIYYAVSIGIALVILAGCGVIGALNNQ